MFMASFCIWKAAFSTLRFLASKNASSEGAGPHGGDALGCILPDGRMGAHQFSAQSKDRDMPWVECVMKAPETEALLPCVCEKTAI
jgi:hypothetical protein